MTELERTREELDKAIGSTLGVILREHFERLVREDERRLTVETCALEVGITLGGEKLLMAIFSESTAEDWIPQIDQLREEVIKRLPFIDENQCGFCNSRCEHGYCECSDDVCPECARQERLEQEAEDEANFQHNVIGPVFGWSEDYLAKLRAEGMGTSLGTCKRIQSSHLGLHRKSLYCEDWQANVES